MTISKSQRTALLWIANNSVTLDTLPKRGHGRLLQNTKNLLRGGLVDEEVGGLLRPTPAGWKALTGGAT